jgi:uncharacterized membrane protein YkoI
MKKIVLSFHDPFIRGCNLQIMDGRQTDARGCTTRRVIVKHNRIFALMASAVLAVGATAAVVPRAFAQSAPTPTPQLQNDNNEQADNTNEREKVGMDGDIEQFQSGDQNGRDEREVGHRDDPIPQGKPAISAEAAIAAARSYLKTADVVERLLLEDENGNLVYSLGIGAADVKVDAMTGKVLNTDNSGE